jgi:type IV secretory pathway VirB10-like protein
MHSEEMSMRTNVVVRPNTPAASLLALAIAMSLTACNGSATTQAPQARAADTAPDNSATRTAELDSRAQELAQREAEVAAREREQKSARQEAAAEVAKREATAKAAAARKAAVAKSASSRKTSPVSTSGAHLASAPAHVSEPIEVPAGTALYLALSADLSTKTAKPGDAFEAHLVSDLTANGRSVAPAGSRVTGTVTNVVSGSHSIGAVPLLSLAFERLELADGRQISIGGELTQQGDSEKARDAAKILGGAAAGAIIGHQVKKNRTGSIVGGVLGGAAGAVVAKNTGTEVELAAGSTLSVTLGQGFTVSGT